MPLKPLPVWRIVQVLGPALTAVIIALNGGCQALIDMGISNDHPTKKRHASGKKLLAFLDATRKAGPTPKEVAQRAQKRKEMG